jgi:hypothetical protein
MPHGISPPDKHFLRIISHKSINEHTSRIENTIARAASQNSLALCMNGPVKVSYEMSHTGCCVEPSLDGGAVSGDGGNFGLA